MGSDRVDHMLRIAISGGGPMKYTNNKKIARSTPQVDLTSAPPINHLHGNGPKQPKSRHCNHQVRSCKSESLPTSTRRTAADFPARTTNSAPESGDTFNQEPKHYFPKINNFVQENVHGLSTAQLAYRENPNGKNWAKHLAGLQETNKYLRAEGSNDKLPYRKQKHVTSLEILPRPHTPGTDNEQTTETNKPIKKLNLSRITSKIDTGQSKTKAVSSPRSSVHSYDYMSKKRIITTLAGRRAAWKRFRRKNKTLAKIISQKNMQTERQLQGVYANNEYKMQRQARVLKKVEDVQYNQVQDFNKELSERERLKTLNMVTQRENLKLLRDRFDAEQVKRFKNQYVSWKSVETDRLARGSDAYGLPDNIYADRYSKKLQPVTVKPIQKKTFKVMATRVRNIQRFRLILNPKTTSDPNKVIKVSDKLLVEGIDTVQLNETDGSQKKHKKPKKVRAVIGSAKRLLSTRNIDEINELSEGEWDDLSSLDLSDNEEI